MLNELPITVIENLIFIGSSLFTISQLLFKLKHSGVLEACFFLLGTNRVTKTLK